MYIFGGATRRHDRALVRFLFGTCTWGQTQAEVQLLHLTGRQGCTHIHRVDGLLVHFGTHRHTRGIELLTLTRWLLLLLAAGEERVPSASEGTFWRGSSALCECMTASLERRGLLLLELEVLLLRLLVLLRLLTKHTTGWIGKDVVCLALAQPIVMTEGF